MDGDTRTLNGISMERRKRDKTAKEREIKSSRIRQRKTDRLRTRERQKETAEIYTQTSDKQTEG